MAYAYMQPTEELISRVYARDLPIQMKYGLHLNSGSPSTTGPTHAAIRQGISTEVVGHVYSRSLLEEKSRRPRTRLLGYCSTVRPSMAGACPAWDCSRSAAPDRRNLIEAPATEFPNIVVDREWIDPNAVLSQTVNVGCVSGRITQ